MDASNHLKTSVLSVAVVAAFAWLPLLASATAPVSKGPQEARQAETHLPETVVATTRSDSGNGKPVRITVSSVADTRANRQVVLIPLASADNRR